MATDKTKTTTHYWKKVFAHIEKGGYGMSGLTKDQIVKIIELMRTTTEVWSRHSRKEEPAHGMNCKELDLVALMLHSVSPRTALLLYTMAWSWNSSLTRAPNEREWRILWSMGKTFKAIKFDETLKLSVHHNTTFHPISLYAWYQDDTIGNCVHKMIADVFAAGLENSKQDG